MGTAPTIPQTDFDEIVKRVLKEVAADDKELEEQLMKKVDSALEKINTRLDNANDKLKEQFKAINDEIGGLKKQLEELTKKLNLAFEEIRTIGGKVIEPIKTPKDSPKGAAWNFFEL